MSICMKRLVYLFELDSVRNSEKEVELGQKTLFEEVAVLGHNVAVSLNQLADSMIFMSIVNDETAYKSMLELFEKDIIKVCLYDSYQSSSQYIQEKLQNEKFVFSNLPLKLGSEKLKLVIEEALRYSSLRKLEEIRDKTGNELYKEQYDCLIRYLSLILFISTKSNVYLQAKDKSKCRTLMFFLKMIMESCERPDYLTPKLLEAKIGVESFVAAIKELIDVQKEVLIQGEEKENDRSNWLTAFESHEDTDTKNLAIAILDLCHNYTIESNIEGITLHYIEDEKNSFLDDFMYRLKEYWLIYRKGNRSLGTISTEKRFDVVIASCYNLWGNATRIICPPVLGSWTKRPIVIWDEKISSGSYEATYLEDRKRWKKKLWKTFWIRFKMAMIYIASFFVFDFLIGLIDLGSWGWAINILGGTVILGIASSVVTKRMDIPDILDSLKYLWWTVKDIWIFYKKVPRNIAYKNNAKIERKNEE